MSKPFLDKPAWAIEDFLVTTVRIELEAQIVVGCCLECEAVLERGLDLNIPAIRCIAVVIRLRDFVKDDVVLEFSDDFANVADQATVDREPPVWKCGLEMLDALKYECETFGWLCRLGMIKRR